MGPGPSLCNAPPVNHRAHPQGSLFSITASEKVITQKRKRWPCFQKGWGKTDGRTEAEVACGPCFPA